MGWWYVIKSARAEAYQNFLDSLFADGFQEEIPVDEGRKFGFIEDPWFVVANDELTGIEIYAIGDEMNQHREFIMGMFEQEYPEDYRELRMRILRLMAEKRPHYGPEPGDLPNFNYMSLREKRIWLEQHIFTVDGTEFNTQTAKRYLLGAFISHYDDISSERVEAIIRDVGWVEFNETDNLKLLFRKYDEVMEIHNLDKIADITSNRLISTGSRIRVVKNLLAGHLNQNPYFKFHFSDKLPFGVRKIDGED